MAANPESDEEVKLLNREEAGAGSERQADRGSERPPRRLYPGDVEARDTDRTGRGRDAAAPSAVPAKGWGDVLLRVYRGIDDDRILANAAAVTFYALLALFPGIAALVSIYALFADPQSIAQHLGALSGVLPGGATDVIRDQLNRLVAQPHGKLGISFLVGLVVSLWSANGGIKALFDALNVVYGEREERGFIRLNGISLIFTAAMIALMIAALACLVALPAALGVLPGFVGMILSYARWPALLVLVSVVLAFTFRYGPDRAEPRWRWVSWGSAFGAVGWLCVSALFTWYAENFGNFNKTYGSLGAVIGFMMWIWLSVTVILIGAKINAETEHQTARDTTEGPEKPLGTRGAKMADTLGPPEGSSP
jgi:membrane protein